MSLVQTSPHGTRPAPTPSGGHIVQFDEDEAALCDEVARFLGEGLAGGERVVAILRRSRHGAVATRLAARGLDVEEAGRRGEALFLDAAETLAEIMSGDAPTRERFERTIGPAIGPGPAGGKPVRAYGEMVDLLWAEGKRTAALHLEQLWNGLCDANGMSLLCTYLLDGFVKASDGEAFGAVCAQHDVVRPASGVGEELCCDRQRREVAMLQQRARALEAEIRHREELELALRDALARLQQSEEALQQSLRISETFVGVLGHDLRNPLMAITTAASLLERLADDRQRKPIERIRGSATRMSRMIDQILDFTRIRTAGGFRIDREEVDSVEVARSVADELLAVDPGCRIDLTCTGRTIGAWDGDLLGQLLSNVIGNAIQHRRPGTVVRVHIDGAGDASVVVSVENQGAVPAEVLPVLFEPFRCRSDRKSARSSGLGLGLYISNQIVRAHGGTIAVESSEAIGTRITLSLPRVGSAACKPERSSAARR